jgi:hypothetical protein
MIKSIMSMGKHNSGWWQQCQQLHQSPVAGMMGVGDLRFNTSTQQIEFYNGQTWQTFTMAQATVGLTGRSRNSH